MVLNSKQRRIFAIAALVATGLTAIGALGVAQHERTLGVLVAGDPPDHYNQGNSGSGSTAKDGGTLFGTGGSGHG